VPNRSWTARTEASLTTVLGKHGGENSAREIISLSGKYFRSRHSRKRMGVAWPPISKGDRI
jgi:hypothetical protein